MEEKQKLGDSSTSLSRSTRSQMLQEAIQKARQASSHQFKNSILDDPYENTNKLKNDLEHKTAYCYVPSVKHYSPWNPKHPENPMRSHSINEALKHIRHRMKVVTETDVIEMNDEDMLLLAHSHEHINNIKDVCKSKNEARAQCLDSIYFNGEDSYASAVSAAKFTTTMAKFIAEGTVKNGFANVRPPGHHASDGWPNGFCLFNNIAIAAKYLLKENPDQKILIVDYDVHHGQGTQRSFYSSNQVLYFSIHRYENGLFWPNLEESNFDFIGEGEGAGYNINIPLNKTGLGDTDYMAIIHNILLPVAYEFNPTIVLISAGYDACNGCPEGKMNVSPAFYSHLITLLGGLAQGKILVVLEGGYFIPSMAEAALRTVHALLGDPCSILPYNPHIDSSVIDSINNAKVALWKYWKCFNQVDSISMVRDILSYDRYNSHVAVRKYFGTTEEPPFPTREYLVRNTQAEEYLHLSNLDYFRETFPLPVSDVGYVANHISPLHHPYPNQRAQEVPQRLNHIMFTLSKFGLIGDKKLKQLRTAMESNDISDIQMIIEKVHSKEYLLKLESEECSKSDLYWNKDSKAVCQASCVALCQLAKEINFKSINHGVAAIRPPGHHAKRDKGNGFCLINNVVVAAEYAISQHGFEKVIILDFDVHHGDGTQELTYNESNIMYVSIHRFDRATFFPNDPAGDFNRVGKGAAAGFNFNIPFEGGKMGDTEYLLTWIKLVLPVCYAFQPSLIFVSAGFDAGVNDPLGGYKVHPEVFGHLVQLVKSIAPVILVLEGGYNLETTALGMVNCVRALLGYSLPRLTLGDMNQAAAKTIASCLSVMKPYWGILEVNKGLHLTISSQSDLDDAVANAKRENES